MNLLVQPQYDRGQTYNPTSRWADGRVVRHSCSTTAR